MFRACNLTRQGKRRNGRWARGTLDNGVIGDSSYNWSRRKQMNQAGLLLDVAAHRSHPQRRRAMLALIAAVVVILASAGITSYLLHRPSTTSPAPQTPTAQSAAPSVQTVVPFTGLTGPLGVAVDTAGNLYVTDVSNNRVLELAAGSATQSVLPFTGLKSPQGVAVDAAGDVYVADWGNHQVVKLAAGSSTQSVLPFTGLTGPFGVAVDTARAGYVHHHHC